MSHSCSGSHRGGWLATRLSVLVVLVTAATAHAEPRAVDVDICVYTATPGGITAAVAAKRAGRTVVIVEPSRWVGGMLGAGLKPMQDCPNYAATGGMTRELLRTLGNDPDAKGFKSSSAISPKDVREDFRKLLEKKGVEVIFEHRVARCEKDGATIKAAMFDLAPFDELGCPVAEPKTRDSLRVTAKVFIDASYEADFLPPAKVSYRVGREAAAEFDEPAAGVQPPMELTPIDPFVEPGRPESGLLKWVEDDHGKAVGAADHFTQAYNYRYYTTADPANRIEIPAPDGYDAKDFELVGRYVEHLVKTIQDPQQLRTRLVGICPGWKNSGEWNYQRASLITMAPLGISQCYADGDYAEKAQVWKQHQDYLRGLFHFMRTDPRVPESYRQEIASLGLDNRYHPETKGWPHQLYVRVARRLRGSYTITAHDVYNKGKVDDPVGLAQYGIDTYPSRRIWVRRDGQVLVGIEGKMFIGSNRGPTDVPYPVSYRCITPQADECTNLLVPVCFSATHLGYASARMEPVFMIVGESAGTAAAMAIKLGVSVQDVPYPQLAEQLKTNGQLLDFKLAATRPAAVAVQPLKLDGIVVDDADATFTGEWTASTRNPQFAGVGYRHSNGAKGLATATFTAKLPKPGRYEVRLYFSAERGRATAVPVTVRHVEGEAQLKVNQAERPLGGDGTFASLGAHRFGETAVISLSTAGADGYVIADAVQLVPQ